MAATGSGLWSCLVELFALFSVSPGGGRGLFFSPFFFHFFSLFFEVPAGSGAPPSSSPTADDTASLAGVPGANEEEADITEAMQSPHHMLSVQ